MGDCETKTRRLLCLLCMYVTVRINIFVISIYLLTIF